MGKASKAKQSIGRREKIAAQRAASRRRERNRRLFLFGGGSTVLAAIIVVVIVLATSSGGGTTDKEVIPPVPTGTAVTQPAPVTVTNNTGISGVTAYVTTGWPTASHNGPASKALRHSHVTGPVRYAVTPPVGGDHNGVWLDCGVYEQPVPAEYAVHDLEHGAIWITYQPSLPASQVSALRSFVQRQKVLTPAGAGHGSRYIDLTPYPGLPSPIVISSWGFQLRVSSPSDPRIQQFVNKFRVSQHYTPEYGAPCTGGIGTPVQS